MKMYPFFVFSFYDYRLLKLTPKGEVEIGFIKINK